MYDNLTSDWLTVFVTASREKEELRKTIDVISEGCGDNLHKIVVVLKDENCPAAHEIKDYLDETHNSKVVPYIQKFKSKNGMNSYIGCVAEIIFLSESSHFTIAYGDFEYTADTLKRMINAAKEEPDAIVGASRWIKGSFVKNYNQLHKVIVNGFNIFISILYGRKITDFSCFLKIYPVNLINKLKIDYAYDIGFMYTFIPLRAGEKYIEVPAEFEKNEISSFGFFNLCRIGIEYFHYILKVRFKSKKSLFRDN